MKKIISFILTMSMIIGICTFTPVTTSAGIEENLIVQYLFNGTSGTSVSDSSGNGFNTTISGSGYSWVQDPNFGTVLNLSGNSAHIRMPNTSLEATRNTSITISSWLYTNAKSDWQRLFDFAQSTSINFFCAPHNSTSMRARITNNGNGNEQGVITSGSANYLTVDSKWHHVVVVLNTDAQTMTLYKDGAVAGTATGVTVTMNDILSTTASNNYLYIGRAIYSDPYLNGRLHDFRVYNTALTQSDVSSLYNEVITDQHKVNADAANITISGDLENVISNLTLASTGTPYATAITWSSSNTNIISNTGVVTRPSTEDAVVTLTATATSASATAKKDFTVTVKKLMSDSDSVKADLAAINLGVDLSRVSSNLTLPTSGAEGSTISWVSSNTSVISNSGTVTPPAEGSVVVTLTATGSKGTYSEQRVFNITVVPRRTVGAGLNIAPNASQIVPSATASPSNAINVNTGVWGPSTPSTGAEYCWETWNVSGSTVNIYYVWDSEVNISSTDVLWWYDQSFGSSNGGVQLPTSCTVQYWTGSAWADVTNMADENGVPVTTVGTAGNGTTRNNTLFNGVTFDPVTTTRLRLTIGQNKAAASATGIGIMEWRVYSDDISTIAFSGVNFPNPDNVIKNLILPNLSDTGYTITWKSLNPEVATDEGVIFKNNTRQTLVMEATAVKGEEIHTRLFNFRVLAINEAPYNLSIDENNLGIKISPLLHGIFFEDINHSLDGGLNAQLIDNASFQQYLWPDRIASGSTKNGPANGNYSQSATTIYSWRAVTKGSGAAGTATIVGDRPMNDNNNYSVRINVTNAGGTSGVHGYGIGANGYSVANYYNNPTPTIAVNAGWKYDASLYLQGEYTGKVTVFLEDASGNLNSNVLEIEGSDFTNTWKKYEAVLTAIRSENNRLVIMGDAVGTFYIDFVQLTPAKEHLWRNGAAGGLRADMAEALEELQPKFMRFPGGCASEGMTELRQYFWKNTVGPREERKGIPNYWGYWSSNELGFFEYFQLAEELGAEPLPVISNGVTCQFHTSSGTNYSMGYVAPIGTPEELDAFNAKYTQDALDLIEFCNGDITTEWGAKRAEYGHPEPFNLKYVAIGNENGGSTSNWVSSAFWDRFDIIYKAVKEKYPDMEVITNSDYLASGSQFTRNYNIIDSNYPATIVDEHYYNADSWFISNSHRYDPGRNRPGMSVTYDRNKPTRVFVGEYAGNVSRNSMYSAVAEAAFTTGLERNSDMVQMACYAPTFAQNSNGARSNWPDNLIWFDNTGIWRTPNYYFHKMFSVNIGDRLVQYSDILQLDGSVYRAGQSDEGVYKVVSKDTKTGTIYIKLVNTESTIKDMRVTLSGDGTYKATNEYIWSNDSTAKNQPTSTQAITNRTHEEIIKPIIESLGNIKESLYVEMKPFSVNVIKLVPTAAEDEDYEVISATMDEGKAQINIKNNNLDLLTIYAVLAAYNDDNELTTLDFIQSEITKGTNEIINLEIDEKDNNKLFLWDADTLSPLTGYEVDDTIDITSLLQSELLE